MRVGRVAVAWIALAVASAGAAGRWERRADMGVPRQEIGLAAVGETLSSPPGRRDAIRDEPSLRLTGCLAIPVHRRPRALAVCPQM